MTASVTDVDVTLLTPDEVSAHIGTEPDQGLSSAEAERRLAENGPNELDSVPPTPRWRKFLQQFNDPLIYLLFGAIVISLAAWYFEGMSGAPWDAIVIAAIVVLNAILGYTQEARAESAVEALKQMSAATSAVVRDGQVTRVPTADLVIGDVLVLDEGEAVGADARLVRSASLQVAEAALTGESHPVEKSSAPLTEKAQLADRTNMVHNGTAVTQGTGRAIVTSTGMQTEMGSIATLLHETQEEPTPLSKEIDRVGKMLGILVIIVAIIVLATVFITAEVDTPDEFVQALLLAVSLAVAAVPEGLPTVLSLVLAVGVQRMAGRKAIVKNLSSVETLGSASVICSDKTGTLTRGEMTIGHVSTGDGAVTVTGVGYRPEGELTRDGQPVPHDDPAWQSVEGVLRGGALANNAVLHEPQTDADGWEVQGDPTEAAFLVAHAKLGADNPREHHHRRGEVPFTSERKLMSSIEVDEGGHGHLVVKGAPDVLLGRCTWVRAGDEDVPLTDESRQRILDDVEALSADAYRTLAVAHRDLADDEITDAPEEDIEHDLTYTGTVGIIDPPREEAKVAIAQARDAGIRVIMITGDHPLTAARIAVDLGLVEPGATALSGSELDDLIARGDEAFTAAVRDYSVFARVTPEHKLRIVDALQSDGSVVAMTGDGVNDAPALKAADIGVAMGITGTEVSKEAAKMILADDNFATILTAVREGRRIFDNIRKSLRYLLSSNMGEVLTVFLGVLLGGVIGLTSGAHGDVVLPLLATQILWINLLTDSAPALALGVDPETDDVMKRQPRGLNDRVIDREMWRDIIFVGLVMAVVTLIGLDLYLPGGVWEGHHRLDEARTVAFTVLVFAQLFNSLNARSDTTSAFKHMFSNHWLWLAILLSVVLQVAVVHVPFLNVAFGTAPLSLEQWAVSIGLAAVVLVASELRKVVLRLVARP
ncbi:cation-translocating P-type ATPase [Kribbia dieselivorans]|uniref:cation-translocating P-type ATPase n=1 Tax=Kribbia dieselivorans TaxID=331526 RepID=UPI000837D178|nr:cation-translocating P-type ATPase [Kribbia dieselivorans]